MQKINLITNTVNTARKLATTMVGVLILGLLTMGCPEPGPTNYTVTLDANGGTAGTITTITVAHGGTVPTNTTGLPTRTGYTLAGWNTQADGSGTAFVFGTTTVTANITIFAQWSQKAPATPTGLTATPISQTQINLSWTATATATSYKLFDGTSQIGGDLTSTSYSHTGLTANSPHSYTLQACNAVGCSEKSAAVSATTTAIVITVTELKDASRDVRPYYAYFTISANTNLSDYYLTMKEKSQVKPTASDIKAGLFYQRNLSSNPIRTLVWGPISATGTKTGTSVASEVIAKMLKPSTSYTLYGMPKDGTDADVKALKDFNTDAVPTSIPTGAATYGHFFDATLFVSDEAIANSQKITLRKGEPIILANAFTGTLPSAFTDNSSTGSLSTCLVSGTCTICERCRR